MNTETEESTSWESGAEPQLMLRVNSKNWVKLLPYAYLVEVTFELDQYVQLEFTSCVVVLHGTNLKELIPLLQNHQVKCIAQGGDIKEITLSDAPATNA